MQLKDKKVEVLRQISERDAIGNSVEKYIPRFEAPLWAYTRLLSMDEYQRYGLNTLSENRIFVLNYHPSIEITDRIRYKNKLYKITMKDTYEDYKSDITLYCERVIPGADK